MSTGRYYRMAKGRLKYVIVIIFVIIIILIGNVQHYSLEYTFKANWDIQIPPSYEEVYHFSPQSFHGDGTRYTILQYNQDISSSFDFVPVTLSHKEIFYELLNQTEKETPKELYPSCINQQIYIQKSELDSLYMIYDANDFKLYIIEDFI